MRNPYKCKGTKQARISIDLIKIIDLYKKKLQRDSDIKFGRNKFIIKRSHASQKLAEVLK